MNFFLKIVIIKVVQHAGIAYLSYKLRRGGKR